MDGRRETLSERLDRILLGVMEEIRVVARRVDSLESRLNPTCGHRDPSSGRACQRPPDHYGEVHRDMTSERDGTVWSTDHSSAEHREGQEPAVLATQMDGRQVMSDGSVKDPAQPPGNKAVLIGLVELGKLRKDSAKLNALEAAGVDNWSGYSHAMDVLLHSGEYDS